MCQAQYLRRMCLLRRKVVVASGPIDSKYIDSAERLSPPQATGDLGQWTDSRPLVHLDELVAVTVWKDRMHAIRCLAD